MKKTLAFLFCFAAMSTASQVLVRQPYIQKLAPVSVTIAFKSDVSVAGGVEYGITDSLGTIVTEAAPSLLHGIDIEGLSPNTMYFYRASLDGVYATPLLSFKTAKDASVPIFSFNAVGDLGCGNTYGCAAVASQYRASESDFGLLLGDIVYDTGADEDYDPKYFANYWRFSQERCNYTSIGNHETYTNSGQPYDDNFFCFNNNAELSERYYSFRYGNALFIALDPVTHGFGVEDTQTLWLTDTLQSSNDFWKFAFFHYQPYSCCYRGSNLALREAWSPIFEQYNLDMAFTAHDHGYERTNVIKDYCPSSRGVVYYVSGGGGYYTYAWNTDCPWTAYAESTYEFLRVEILGARARTCGVKTDGTLFDCAAYLKSDIPFNLYTGTNPSALTLCQPNTILECSMADGIPADGVVFYYQMDGPVMMHLEKNADGLTTTISHQDFQ
jgi:acid phosphatase type 7